MVANRNQKRGQIASESLRNRGRHSSVYANGRRGSSGPTHRLVIGEIRLSATPRMKTSRLPWATGMSSVRTIQFRFRLRVRRSWHSSLSLPTVGLLPSYS